MSHGGQGCHDAHTPSYSVVSWNRKVGAGGKGKKYCRVLKYGVQYLCISLRNNTLVSCTKLPDNTKAHILSLLQSQSSIFMRITRSQTSTALPLTIDQSDRNSSLWRTIPEQPSGPQISIRPIHLIAAITASGRDEETITIIVALACLI